MDILVIGGRGYLGRRAVAGLERADGVAVHVGGRSGDGERGVRVDLNDPSTYAALERFDLVVNCSDSLTARADEAIAWTLARGGRWLETTSEPETIRRVLAQHRGADASAHRGTVVLGAGIFTGLSNLMGADAARLEGATSLVLGIRWSPLAGGGGGMVNLMRHLVGVEALRYRDGVEERCPPVSRGPALPFGSGRARTMQVAFAEPTMLHASTGLAQVSAHASIRPGMLRPVFLSTPRWLLESGAMRALLWVQFSILRRVVLRWRRSAVEMVAVARAPDGREAVVRVETDDGMEAAGGAIAAMAEALAGQSLPAGVRLCDEHLTLEPMATRAAQLAATRVELSHAQREPGPRG